MNEYKEADPVSLTEKIEIISTEDEKIKSVGELLSSDSSRTILKLLFEDIMTANQISQKTGISLPLVIYHLKKMQDMGIVKVSNVGKNVKAQDMKFYTTTKFAIVILPSSLSQKAKTSKSLANSFKTIYRFASIGVAGVATWFVSQFAQNFQTTQTGLQENLQAPMMEAPMDVAREAAEGGELAMEKTMESAMAPLPSIGISPDVFWSVVFALSVIIVGLIIERVWKAYKH
ncbi:MAG TPA: winged helix-turn-helix domain-containing protein [Nitrosopumilaceae archaeon]|nr:winged helix-turn-helix domain-containing protein [Nitrosopumilaceae archaeon]